MENITDFSKAKAEKMLQEKEERRAKIVKTTLESALYKTLIGGNEAQNVGLYGSRRAEAAKSEYIQAQASEEWNKQRQGLLEQKTQEADKLGINLESPNVSSYEVQVKMAEAFQEVTAMAKLSELEKYAVAAGAKLDFKIPDKLKDYIPIEVQQKAVSRANGDSKKIKLSEDEEATLGLHQALYQSLKRAYALSIGNDLYFTEANKVGKGIEAKYNPKPENESDSGKLAEAA
jgi:hypothetical protein